MPAPPPLSEPAMVSATGQWVILDMCLSLPALASIGTEKRGAAGKTTGPGGWGKKRLRRPGAH